MNSSALYNFKDDSVVKKKLYTIINTFDNPQVTNQARLNILAPMLIHCNESMYDSVQAVINECIMRKTYLIGYLDF